LALLKAGDQLPFMFSIDIEGSGFTKMPLQIGSIGLKLGITLEVIPIVIVEVVAHCP
jgi:hypothetical protein